MKDNTHVYLHRFLLW